MNPTNIRKVKQLIGEREKLERTHYILESQPGFGGYFIKVGFIQRGDNVEVELDKDPALVELFKAYCRDKMQQIDTKLEEL